MTVIMYVGHTCSEKRSGIFKSKVNELMMLTLKCSWMFCLQIASLVCPLNDISLAAEFENLNIVVEPLRLH